MATRDHNNKTITCEVQSGDFLLTNSSLVLVQYPPKFVDERESIKLKVTHGDDFMLNCQTFENPEGSVTWFYTANGSKLRKNIQNNHRILQIDQMDESKQGEYECFVENTIGRVSRSFKVADYPKRKLFSSFGFSIIFNHFNLITGPPKILMDRDVIIVNETDAIDLVCESFNSLPINNFSWFNENSNHYERFVIKDEKNDVFKSVLRINEIDESDNGSFECILANEAGEDKFSFELLVQTVPKIDAIMMKKTGFEEEVENEVSVIVNDDVTIDCITDGFPTPDIRWFKDQDEIMNESNGTAFRIHQVQEDEDGKYQCLATNILGSTTKVISLTVNVPPKTASLDTTTKTVLENNNLSLICDVYAKPAPQINWTINGKPVEGMNRITISKDRKMLTRHNVILTDSGTFTCTGINGFGNVSINYNVLVTSKSECFNLN